MESQLDFSRPIDFAKIDKKRPQEINDQIVKLFNNFINTFGIDEILTFYKSQGSLLHIKRDNNNQLFFYGCNDNIEHHSSNIEYIVKFLLHKMLHDNGSKKILLDSHSLTLVGFGILPLMSKDKCGNVYRDFNGQKRCNVGSYQVSLSDEQVKSIRMILRLIRNKEPLN